MITDYSKGRYLVYQGRGPLAPLAGIIDGDEFVRDMTNGRLLYRVDGEEFYDMAGQYIGEITTSEGVGMVVRSDPTGINCLFVIRKE